MDESNKLSGIALLCDNNGLITRVIRDDFGIIPADSTPRLISTVVLKNDLANVLDFILKVRENGMVFDCPMPIKVGNTAKTINLTGFNIDSNLLIIGVDSPTESLKFINQLQQINNEQANQIRDLLKKKYSNPTQSDKNSSMFLEELTSLNNELVNLQRELAKKNAELIRLNNLKSEFLGMAAHDIRNPLGVIISYSDFLLEQTQEQLSVKHYNFIKSIYSSAEFLLALIEDLLDITQIESGKLTLNSTKIDIVELAKRNIELNNTLASRKNINISFTSSQNEIELYIDARKIEQVFNNLLTNAVKFSYPNSEVQVFISQQAKSVLVEVIDQGIGIEKNYLDKIFVPFNVLDSEGTGGEKCTGLGLSIVKKIVEGHNGSIFVESTPGKGSRFFFVLPLE